MIKFNLIL